MKGLNKFSRKKKEFNPTVFFFKSIHSQILYSNYQQRSPVDSFIHFASHGVKFHSFGMSNDRLYKLIHRLVITY